MTRFSGKIISTVLVVGSLFFPFSSFTVLAQKRDQTENLENRVRVYEATCVQNLRAINVAQGAYRSGSPVNVYATTLAELGPQGTGLLESKIASGKKDGYLYRLIPQSGPNPGEHYVVVARPIKLLLSGQRSFFTDETGVIRYTSKNRAATLNDPAIN